MKKVWNIPAVEMLDLRETAFGVTNPEVPDSQKTQVTIGDKEGWMQLYGEGNTSM